MTMIKDTNISRRRIMAAAVGAGILGNDFATMGMAVAASESSEGAQGLLSVYKLGPVILHNYMAPSSSSVVTTQIIETSNELHIIDTQFIQAIAKEVRNYVDSLGKPVAGVYLSHWHPDHLLGASQFAKMPFTTTADIRADCDKNLETYLKRKTQFEDKTSLELPDGILTTGEHDWDGVSVVIDQVNDCESEHALTFYIPEAGLMIVQDLMFNNAHAFPLGKHVNWINSLKKIRDVEELRIIGCGHGLPATSGAVTDAISYLEFQKAVLSTENDTESAIAALTASYPGFEGQGSLRFIASLYE